MDEKVVLRQYKRRSRVTIALVVGFVLAVLFSSCSIVLKFVLVALLFAAEIVVLGVLMNRTANLSLTDKLDPQLYYTVSAKLNLLHHNALTQIITAYYLYDYQAAYNLCVQKLASSHGKKHNFDYKLYLARMYFDGGEIEKLREICAQFEEAFETNKTLRVLYGDLMHFYRLFCEGDYATCCAFYKQRMTEKSYATQRLFKVQVDYGYAVACYKNGDVDEAMAYFKSLINEAPKLNFARIAQQYLDTMERHEERGTTVTYTKDDSYCVPDVVAEKPSVSKWRLLVLLIAVVVIVVSVGMQNVPRTSLEAVQAYDESVSKIVCSLPIEGSNDLLCLCVDDYGEYVVAYLRAKQHDKYQCKLACTGLSVDSWYQIQSPDSDVRLVCSVYNDAAAIPSDAVCRAEFTYRNITQYFVVTSLGKHRSWTYNAMWLDSAD